MMKFRVFPGSRINMPSHSVRCMLRSVFNAALCIMTIFSPARLTAQDIPWPIEAEHYTTSSFGEPRPGRFHFGVDFTSNRVIGKPVYAIGNGSITRVATSPFGYGKMLELTLEDGRMAVYGHLSAYLPAIEDSLCALRERRHSYEVEMEFPAGLYRARKGDVICWSGETGAGPPHLHVELRDSGGSPLNLMDHGLAVRDTIPPDIGDVALIPLDRNSAVNGSPPAGAVRLRFGRAGISQRANRDSRDSQRPFQPRPEHTRRIPRGTGAGFHRGVFQAVRPYYIG